MGPSCPWTVNWKLAHTAAKVAKKMSDGNEVFEVRSSLLYLTWHAKNIGWVIETSFVRIYYVSVGWETLRDASQVGALVES